MTAYYVSTPSNRDRLRDAGYKRTDQGAVAINNPVISVEYSTLTFKVIADPGICEPIDVFLSVPIQAAPTPATSPEYPHLNLYKNTRENQQVLFGLGYLWAAGNNVVHNLDVVHSLDVTGHISANTTSKRFCLDTVVYAGHKVYEYVATGPESVKERFPALTKSALKLPNDYEFIARSLTTEQWAGYCMGNIINDRLNGRETEKFFNDVFNKYKGT